MSNFSYIFPSNPLEALFSPSYKPSFHPILIFPLPSNDFTAVFLSFPQPPSPYPASLLIPTGKGLSISSPCLSQLSLPTETAISDDLGMMPYIFR